MSLDKIIVIADDPFTVKNKLHDKSYPVFLAESIDDLRELSERTSRSRSDSRFAIVIHPDMSPDQSVPLLKIAERSRPLLVVAHESSVNRIVLSRFQATRKVSESSNSLEAFDAETFEDYLNRHQFNKAINMERNTAPPLVTTAQSNLPRKDKMMKLLVDRKDE